VLHGPRGYAPAGRRNMKTTLWGTAATAGTAALLLAGMAAPASAAEAPSPGVLSAGETQTVTDDASGLTTTIELGTPESTTAAAIKGDAGLSATAKSEILAADAVAAVSSNHWSQFTTGGAYTNTQNGTFYYDGSRVWVSETVQGTTGSHTCFSNYVAPGWTISNITTAESGSAAQRNLSCNWNVLQPVGVTTSASMTANLSANGTISGFGATVG